MSSPPIAEPPAQPQRADRDACWAAWLARAAQGDAAAFEQFYDASIGCARALAQRMLRADTTDDVLSEAYFQAWREAPRFDPERGSAATWLLLRVRSRALDQLRARRQHATLDDGTSSRPTAFDDEAPTDQIPSGLPGPDELFALAEDGSRLHAALVTLSPDERWVLGLAYFRELSQSEIATATGLPLGTVKTVGLRARQKLRDTMAPRSPRSTA